MMHPKLQNIEKMKHEKTQRKTEHGLSQNFKHFDHQTYKNNTFR